MTDDAAAPPTSESDAAAPYPQDELDDASAEPAEEAVQGLPVLAPARSLSPVSRALPAVQAAAVAATGFVAGAATLALLRRRSARRLACRRGAPRRAADVLPIVSSRTFIVDIHLLAKSGQ